MSARDVHASTCARPSLIETLRYEDGYVRLDAHLARLEASSRALRYEHRPEDVRLALARAAAGRAGAWRVRLLVPPDGHPTWQARPLEAPIPEPVDVALADDAIDGRDPWRRHKTTHRARYDAASAEAARRGLADLLFGDGEGFLVDGAVSSLFVRFGDRVLTPPVRRGALPGVLRAELLTQGWAEERDVTSLSLRKADAIWIGSSLRGLRRARVVG